MTAIATAVRMDRDNADWLDRRQGRGPIGHRTYLPIGTKLISTEVRKAPIAKGHRTWLEPKSDRTEKVAA